MDFADGFIVPFTMEYSTFFVGFILVLFCFVKIIIPPLGSQLWMLGNLFYLLERKWKYHYSFNSCAWTVHSLSDTQFIREYKGTELNNVVRALRQALRAKSCSSPGLLLKIPKNTVEMLHMGMGRGLLGNRGTVLGNSVATEHCRPLR